MLGFGYDLYHLSTWSFWSDGIWIISEPLSSTTCKTHFGNGHKWPLVTGAYRSSVTNEPRKVTGRCPLLLTHIRNGHQTTTVTITNHQSREMAVSLGPQRTLVTGTKTEPVTVTQHQRRVLWNCTHYVKLRLRCLDEMRHIYFTRVSAQLGFVTSIKQQPLPQLVIGHVKMIVSLGPQGTMVTGTRTKPVTVK
jgi:hypothetical protein